MLMLCEKDLEKCNDLRSPESVHWAFPTAEARSEEHEYCPSLLPPPLIALFRATVAMACLHQAL